MPTENEAAQEELEPEARERIEKVWKKAYGVKTQDDLVCFYADWAADYDRDHDAIGFIGHRITAELLASGLDDLTSAHVLDAGAGTGAAGTELSRLGVGHLTAIDISPAMLEQARTKSCYERSFAADLGKPVDQLHTDEFDAAILVGVFSYGQAPACALEEILRVVRPGGLIAFTARDDFWDSDEMGVRGMCEKLESDGAWRLVTTTRKAPYLPKKDPEVSFRSRLYEVLPGKREEAHPAFVEAVRNAMASSSPVRVIDHRHIWDAAATRLYNEYIERPEYYLTQCEEEILKMHAERIVGDSHLFVELGCGSARKVSHLLGAAIRRQEQVHYVPIDVSDGAVADTVAEVEEAFGDEVTMHPEVGLFAETLPRIPYAEPKTILFFGGSVGNMPTLEDSIAFLKDLRAKMTTEDRLIVGFDLQKPKDVFISAYNAGEENREFFLHMVRRMNHVLGANFDLSSFQLGSTYDDEPSYRGMNTRCVNLKVVTRIPQNVRIGALDMDVNLAAGDAIQVGVSRKFQCDDVIQLADLADFRVRTLWFDHKHFFTLAELVPQDDADD